MRVHNCAFVNSAESTQYSILVSNAHKNPLNNDTRLSNKTVYCTSFERNPLFVLPITLQTAGCTCKRKSRRGLFSIGSVLMQKCLCSPMSCAHTHTAMRAGFLQVFVCAYTREIAACILDAHCAHCTQSALGDYGGALVARIPPRSSPATRRVFYMAVALYARTLLRKYIIWYIAAGGHATRQTTTTTSGSSSSRPAPL